MRHNTEDGQILYGYTESSRKKKDIFREKDYFPTVCAAQWKFVQIVFWEGKAVGGSISGY